MIVDIFVPCFIDQLYPETAFNMVKVLEGAGCKVNYIEQQTCCGQLAFNSGYWDDAKEVGEKFLKEFSGDRYIVVPSGSCCGFMRNYYGTLFKNTVLHNHFKEVKTKLFEFFYFYYCLINGISIYVRHSVYFFYFISSFNKKYWLYQVMRR